MDYIGKIIDRYNEKGIQKRLGSVIDKIGFDKFSREVLGE
jgi:dissimilatory sulfite reductase (desulfoviridin) alpha/beta subunit